MNREAIAKIIDPEAWDEISADDNEEGAAIFAEAWDLALSKADDIIGLEEGCSSSDTARREGTNSLPAPEAAALVEAPPACKDCGSTSHIERDGLCFFCYNRSVAAKAVKP